MSSEKTGENVFFRNILIDSIAQSKKLWYNSSGGWIRVHLNNYIKGVRFLRTVRRTPESVG